MAEFKSEDKIWRISSLTAYVDEETKILLLPVPESKRTTKIKDTQYDLKSIKDLLGVKHSIEKDLEITEEVQEVKRYEDKTQEEIFDEMHKKRQK